MRIEQLEYIAAVARLGSFRRAAEELHISQPALSETVRSLERELGVDILNAAATARGSAARAGICCRASSPCSMRVDRLRQAAGELHHSARMVRVGTVNAATVPLLTPAIREFREAHRGTQVEVVGAQQADIHRAILEGSFDLGLVNYLAGDDRPPELDTTTLLRGRPVVCMRPDSPLAARDAVRRRRPAVRAADRDALRLSHAPLRAPAARRTRSRGFSYSTDGAEMGKLMVAEGLGVTVLPEFSVIGDPLELSGVITWRPLADDATEVQLAIQRLRSGSPARAAGEMYRIFRARARDYTDQRSGSVSTP